MKVRFPLEKAALSKGGDKYTGELGGDKVSIYVPQTISRPHGKPAAAMIVSVEPEGI